MTVGRTRAGEPLDSDDITPLYHALTGEEHGHGEYPYPYNWLQVLLIGLTT
jgi:hypothetical protein